MTNHYTVLDVNTAHEWVLQRLNQLLSDVPTVEHWLSVRHESQREPFNTNELSLLVADSMVHELTLLPSASR